MKSFDIEDHLQDYYSSFPEAEDRPVIGITSNFSDSDVTLRAVYCSQVANAGGIPFVIPPINNKDVIVDTLSHIDGLILSGGADINPLWFGEEPEKNLHHINGTRDLPELLLARLAFNRQIPMLGICRGTQLLAAALGGRLTQDIQTNLKHEQDADKDEPTHSVQIDEDSTLFDIFKTERIFVNSFHHQAISDPGSHFQVVAHAPDGIIEAIESNEFKPIIGVQWHPEWFGDNGKELFVWLTRKATAFSKAKKVHQQVLSLDSHCDTPMLLSQGVSFLQRDPRILVDLHKMTDGRLDAVTLAAYLPQPRPEENFKSKVDIETEGPKDYADRIFDIIKSNVGQSKGAVAIARTPEDLYRNKHKGIKSVLLGIENGLALEDDVNNVRYFAERGVTYITLCHNGDNAICDSNIGQETHHGVSPFGEEVIKAMNKEGVVVDLSHAAEKSFYDAVEISNMPVVCSHSNCKALCDVPRNLTDDQLRKIAECGGVAHITLYQGFLVKEGEASIFDAMDHLEHAIDVTGVDHVGLGTDFDGDGGVKGLADASELINFTLQLLQRKFSLDDIAKIWGGNWIRVMKEVQSVREINI